MMLAQPEGGGKFSQNHMDVIEGGVSFAGSLLFGKGGDDKTLVHGKGGEKTPALTLLTNAVLTGMD